jgi:hypothetical protein
MNLKSEVPEANAVRLTTGRVGHGIRAAKLQELYNQRAGSMFHPDERTGCLSDFCDRLKESRIERRTLRFLKSKNLKKPPRLFKVSNDNRKVVDVFQHRLLVKEGHVPDAPHGASLSRRRLLYNMLINQA